MRIPFAVPPPGTSRFDVAGLGLNSIDLVSVVAGHPAPNSKQRLEHFARCPGGQIATAMVACARLGLTAHYVGSFGDDDLGIESRASLTAEGVCTDGARVAAGATNQFAVVLVDARTGDRTVLWDRHPGLTMSADDVPRAAVTSGRMLVVDCHETAAATRAARYAREAGIPTVVDVERVRPGIHDLLRQIDAIIAAEGFPAELTGHAETGRALEAMAAEFRAPLVCVTLGREGSLARVGGREFRTPGFAVECVDSTGAGDAFRGGFAAACLLPAIRSVEETLLYANAVAALNCQALGARGGLPDAEQVQRLLGAR